MESINLANLITLLTSHLGLTLLAIFLLALWKYGPGTVSYLKTHMEDRNSILAKNFDSVAEDRKQMTSVTITMKDILISLRELIVGVESHLKDEIHDVKERVTLTETNVAEQIVKAKDDIIGEMKHAHLSEKISKTNNSV